MVRAMEFITKNTKGAPPAVLAIAGDEAFFVERAKLVVRNWTVGSDPGDFVYSIFEGPQTTLAEVLDEARTAPFIGDRKLVVVNEADKFVSQHRAALERYVAAPSSVGVLLLVVDSLNAKTKLATALEDKGLVIDAKPIPAWTTAAWCVQWAKHEYGKKLAKPTADWLVELAGTTLGVLDRELDKLATAIADAEEIDLAIVNRLTAGTRVESAFKLLDAVFEGRMHDALANLDRQLFSGESPVGILALLTSQLRKLTAAARLAVAGRPLAEAVVEAGMPRFAVDKSIDTLRRIGRGNMASMYRRLLGADLNLKGGTELSHRAVLDRFLVDLHRMTLPTQSPPAKAQRAKA